MKNLAITLLLGTLAVPGLAFAHSGHAPLAGLPDLLLHHPWTALLMLGLGLGGLCLHGVRRARSRRR
ncbi:MAG: hypothetical protein ACLGHR_06785 [Gammaproteobacteria bacterium]